MSRSDLFKQAENIMNELSSSKAVLEVNFSSEVRLCYVVTDMMLLHGRQLDRHLDG